MASRRMEATQAAGRATGKKKKDQASPSPRSGADALPVAELAAKAALDKKAEDVVILDVRGLTTYADYIVVATGTSDRQVMAIADGVEEKMREAGHRSIGTEGYARGHWVLIDFADVVVHVFYEEARSFYDVEGLWADAKRIPME